MCSLLRAHLVQTDDAELWLVNSGPPPMAATTRAEVLNKLHLKTIVKVRARAQFVGSFCAARFATLRLTAEHAHGTGCTSQEHHAQPARQLVMNTMDAEKRNMFATVASNQARDTFPATCRDRLVSVCERRSTCRRPPYMTTSTLAAMWQ